MRASSPEVKQQRKKTKLGRAQKTKEHKNEQTGKMADMTIEARTHAKGRKHMKKQHE